jgi:hypothetical protein
VYLEEGELNRVEAVAVDRGETTSGETITGSDETTDSETN